MTELPRRSVHCSGSCSCRRRIGIAEKRGHRLKVGQPLSDPMMRIETLEPRICFASLWQNPDLPLDIDGSRDVTPADTEIIWQRLRQSDAAVLPNSRTDVEMFYDPSGDEFITPLDALLIINALNRYTDPVSIHVEVAANDDLNGNGVIVGDRMQVQGTTLPDVSLDVLLNSQSEILKSLRSDAAGRFQFELPLTRGEQSLQVVATDPLGRIESSDLSVQCTDLVSDWNAMVLNAIRADQTPPPQAAKNLAMIHTAMFDAANAADQQYAPYLPNLIAPADTSPEAASAAAAYHVAKHLYPAFDHIVRWDNTFAESLRQIPDGPSKETSITFGFQVGEAMLRLRDRDGSQLILDDRPHSDWENLRPGAWRPTPPAYADALLPQWKDLKPFAIQSPDQFRPGPPPELDSQAYADAVDEVLKIGGTESLTRTDEQTEIGVFWADADGTFTPPGHWNQIAGNVLNGENRLSNQSVVESARVYAMLNLALADAGIASWDAKYEYDLWRPIDAIRNADSDGNDQTIADPSWTSEWINPPFPAYTSGHSSFSGAADSVLSVIFGDHVAFTSRSDPAAFDQVVTRSFTSFAEAADEAGVSRIYGGIHFNFDNTAGLEAGRNVGRYIAQNFLQPITRS